jgi:hypothetical protein
MLSPYLYFSLALVPLAAVLLFAAKRSRLTFSPPGHLFGASTARVPVHLKLWAAIVLLSAVEGLVFRLAQLSVAGPVYVGANFFAVAVLLLAVPSPTFATSEPVPLLHLFANVACAVYLRAASWLLFTGSAS